MPVVDQADQPIPFALTDKGAVAARPDAAGHSVSPGVLARSVNLARLSLPDEAMNRTSPVTPRPDAAGHSVSPGVLDLLTRLANEARVRMLTRLANEARVREVDALLREHAAEQDCGARGPVPELYGTCNKRRGHESPHMSDYGQWWTPPTDRERAARAEAAHLWTIRTRQDEGRWKGEAFKGAELRYCSVGEPSELTAYQHALAFVRSMAGAVPVTVVPAAPVPAPEHHQAADELLAELDASWDSNPLEAAMAVSIPEDIRDRVLHELKRREDFYDNVERVDGTITDVKGQEDEFLCRLLSLFGGCRFLVLLLLALVSGLSGCGAETACPPEDARAWPFRGMPSLPVPDAGTDAGAVPVTPAEHVAAAQLAAQAVAAAVAAGDCPAAQAAAKVAASEYAQAADAYQRQGDGPAAADYTRAAASAAAFVCVPPADGGGQ